jgi:hypothetical protein
MDAPYRPTRLTLLRPPIMYSALQHCRAPALGLRQLGPRRLVSTAASGTAGAAAKPRRHGKASLTSAWRRGSRCGACLRRPCAGRRARSPLAARLAECDREI